MPHLPLARCNRYVGRSLSRVARPCRTIVLLCVLLASLFGHPAGASAARERDGHVPRPTARAEVQSFSLQSHLMGRTYDITIGLPEGYANEPARRYPALVVTDGRGMFPLANAMARRLGDRRIEGGGRIEQIIVIGVGGLADEDQRAETRRRVYEFSPPGWYDRSDFSDYMKNYCRTALGVEPADCVGGAPRFLDFLVNELLPIVARRYRVDPNDLGLSGHSAGGFFTTWAMFQPTSPFTRYIASSPVMNYGNSEIFRQEAGYAAAHRDLPIKAYLSSGVLEIYDAGLEDLGKIVSGQAQLANLLRARNYPGLSLYSEFHQGLGHEDVPPVSFARGLRLLYPNVRAGRPAVPEAPK